MVSFHKIDPKWWSCERKKRFASLPDPVPNGMRAYECKYCLGIHLATDTQSGGMVHAPQLGITRWKSGSSE